MASKSGHTEGHKSQRKILWLLEQAAADKAEGIELDVQRAAWQAASLS